MILRILFFILVAGSTALSADLQRAYPATSNLTNPVRVEFSLQNDNLLADFTVHTPTINALPTLGPNQYPFQHDVVEVFVSAAGDANHLPYFEFELSPFDQTFEVKIIDSKRQMISGVHMGITHSVEKIDGGWLGHLSIPLKALDWNGQPETVFGNAYSVLGAGANRSYWSLFKLIETKPNFHLPDFFQALLPSIQ